MKTKILIIAIIGLFLATPQAYAQRSVNANRVTTVLDSFDLSDIAGSDTTFYVQIPNYDLTLIADWTSLTGAGTLEYKFHDLSGQTSLFEYDTSDPVDIALSGTDKDAQVLEKPGFKYLYLVITKSTITAGTLTVTAHPN